ncbi:membrane-spanning 4-domains subfamily A member 4A-like [Ursus americanus]|uniref:membrane-spanning 4-domains subfamily A member 4A-like n=1 Tax=Ursus americanus TaxID=9643 RepID=UPI001E67C619|nr:membrane-spanning 4-domains subfamily A member 4A-like [Ursus americanus]XP_045643049.1 membrane-spanning 4-domains subfamily A member 4A-like [Ursus americanus]
MGLQRRDPAIHQGRSGPMPFPHEAQNNLQNFLKGKPVILGVSQIMIGLMNICLWIMIKVFLSFHQLHLALENSAHTFIFLLGPIFLLLSGTVSIVSGKKTTKQMGITFLKLILVLLGLVTSVLLSAFGCSAVCCDMTSVVVDLSSNERGLPMATLSHDYDEVAFQPT